LCVGSERETTIEPRKQKTESERERVGVCWEAVNVCLRERESEREGETERESFRTSESSVFACIGMSESASENEKDRARDSAHCSTAVTKGGRDRSCLSA